MNMYKIKGTNKMVAAQSRYHALAEFKKSGLSVTLSDVIKVIYRR